MHDDQLVLDHEAAYDRRVDRGHAESRSDHGRLGHSLVNVKPLADLVGHMLIEHAQHQSRQMAKES
jgi:hypothetical protein